MVSKLAFRNLFKQNEKRAIYAAAEQVVDIKIWLDDLNSVNDVDLTDPVTAAGLNALEAAGLIGKGRAAEILGVGTAAQTAFGFTVGQMVRVREPFGVAYPDQYPVDGFGDGSITVAGCSFAPEYLEAV